MVLCSLPLWLLQLLPLINVILTITGVLVGWVYLRFYQQKGKGAKGDLRDGFAFATFFPKPLQYVFSSHFISSKLYSHVCYPVSGYFFTLGFYTKSQTSFKTLHCCLSRRQVYSKYLMGNKCFYILNFHICKI